MQERSYRNIKRPDEGIVRQQESIETDYLKKNTLIVNTILLVAAAPLLYLLHLKGSDGSTLLMYALSFVGVSIINIAFYAYEDYFNSLRLSMYITTLFMYVIIAAIIFEIGTASSYALLFITYAIASLYQDKKTAFLNNVAVFFVGASLLVTMPEIMILGDGLSHEPLYIYGFLIVFVALLSLASYASVKRKAFFYSRLARAKEADIRLVSIVLDLHAASRGKTIDNTRYYAQLEAFSETLSKAINIENVFMQKIESMRALNQADQRAYAQVPKGLKNLHLTHKSKLEHLFYKASQAHDKSEEGTAAQSIHVPSLKHPEESTTAKIIAFAVFYTMLKIPNPLHDKLDEKVIRTLIEDTDFYYRMDSDITRIYFENQAVFEKIVEDAFKGRVKS